MSTVGFAPVTLTGKGDKIAKFTIPEDAPAIAVVKYTGGGNFAVISRARNGDTNDLLVNEIGKYSGTVLFDSSLGEHSVAFEITASGSWTITIKPISAARQWPGTTKLTGNGDDVILVTGSVSGLTTATITHSGASNFAVLAYAPDDTSLLVNEIGKYHGEVVMPDGTVLLEITADGGWTVALS